MASIDQISMKTEAMALAVRHSVNSRDEYTWYNRLGALFSLGMNRRALSSSSFDRCGIDSLRERVQDVD